MSGLQVVNDTEFTVRLKAPTIDFTLRLAFTPFYPLPESAFKDMAAFGQQPDRQRAVPAGRPGDAWQHNVQIDLVPNPDYHGNRTAKNKGLRFVFYANLDTAYADLLAGNLDVLDTIPPSALPIYRNDLGDRALTGPTAPEPDARHPAAAAALRRRGGPAAPAGAVGGHQPAADLRADIQRNPLPGKGFHRAARCRDSTRTCRATTR